MYKTKFKIGKCNFVLKTKFKKYINKSDYICNFIRKNKKLIKRNINLPKKIIFNLNKIKGDTFGEAIKINKNKYKINLDVRYDLFEIVDTILHELIHIDQYMKGKLKLKWDYKKEIWKFYWKDKYVKIRNEDCYDEYVKLPWEIEAYSKTFKLLKRIKTDFEIFLR